MRKLPIVAIIVASGLVSSGIFIGGILLQQAAVRSATQRSATLVVAAGIRMCVPNPQAKPAEVFISARNTASTPVDILSASAGGFNIRPGAVWLLASSDPTNSAGAGLVPFSSIPGWDSRKSLSRVLAARGDGVLAATVTFPYGISSGAAVEEIDVRYRASNGTVHVARSHVRADFAPTC
jgi:hypothetical protein